jgi:hypothetical protein
MGACKIGELPRHNSLGLLLWGRSLKMHIKIKKGSCFTKLRNMVREFDYKKNLP